MTRVSVLALVLAMMCSLAHEAAAQQGRGAGRRRAAPEAPAAPVARTMPQAWADALSWRPIGPANMGGRITALAVYEADPKIWWAATASGGLLKTTDDGISFEHQFEHEAVASIGDVAVAQSDPNVVWVGTGENNPRNSVSWGNGVYKSTDGGKTFLNMGLTESYQIGRIAIHPTDPNVVYVGALGRLWGPNDERGLYKTIDGGKTWRKILWEDENTGVIEVQLQPGDPETLLVATYERRRDGFDTNDPALKHGEKSAIYKSSDGGKTFRKITNGLPTSKMGRFGIDYYRKDPNIVYALVECEKIGMEPENAAYLGLVGENAEVGAKVTELTEGGPAEKAGLKIGDIILDVGDEKVLSYQELIRAIRKKAAGDTVAIQLSRDRKPLNIDLTFGSRPTPKEPEEGRGNNRPATPTPPAPFLTRLGGQVANVQDQQGPDGHEYGGLYRSADGGESWERINSVNPRPMYFSQVRVDPADENHIWVLGVSTQYSSDRGKTFDNNRSRGVHADGHALWINPNDGNHLIHGCDGGLYVSRNRGRAWDHLNHVAIGQFYHVAVDATRGYRVYGGLQDNGTWGGPSFSRDQNGPINQDWLRIGGGDGFVCRVDRHDPDLIYYESQNGGTGRRHLKSGETGFIRPGTGRGRDRNQFRFNWRTPFVLSHHNSKIYYVAGNRVFRSLDRGTGLRAISPEIPLTKRGSATALAESSIDPDQLWVGTDDGALWMTSDGGKEWTSLMQAPAAPAAPEVVATTEAAMSGPRIAERDDDEARPLHEIIPGPFWVAAVVPSRFDRARAYVALDGHRSNRDEAFVYRSDDAGKTWRTLSSSLPEGCGSARTLVEDDHNENVLWLGTEFFAFLSIDRGTTWTKINGNLPTVAVHAFAQSPACQEVVAATHGRSLWILDATPLRQMNAEVLAADYWLFRPDTAIVWKREARRGDGLRRFVGDNPSTGATFHYTLGKDASEVRLQIRELDGTVLIPLDGETKAGLHRIVWDLRRVVPDEPGARSRRQRMARVGPGTYEVALVVDGRSTRQRFEVKIDPEQTDASFIAFEDEEDEREADFEEQSDDREAVIIY